ncbi:NXPE family member 2-like [Bombina bombina]|uniref:NXPE family member 2-like n=1 Tax=Bombina bombina TaxID=8345 RepID=UPI00235AF55B|nr:NXPE family member 2-like [Bombina bombina]
MALIKTRLFLPILFTMIFVLGFMWHQKPFQNALSFKILFKNCHDVIKGGKEGNNSATSATMSKLQIKINEIFNKIERLIPNAAFLHLNKTTNARNSLASLTNPKEKYCVGENFVIQLDMYNYLGERKTNGGDYIRARIFSKPLGASISGKVEDFKNGTYHVHFLLHWEGRVNLSAKLMHPREAISALWRARHSSLGVIGFQGKFVSLNQEAITTCGFKLDTEKEVCEYVDPGDEEAFYCIKPPSLPCESLRDMTAVKLGISYLTEEETEMFIRSNIGVEIPKNFEFIDVVSCNKAGDTIKPTCQIGMSSPFPSGYFFNNTWNPVYCNMTSYKSAEDFTQCLQGKKLFLIGDSTLRQYIMHFTEDIKIVSYFNYHLNGWKSWIRSLLALNIEKDIYVSYSRHGFPLESFMFYYFQEDKYTSRQIDLLGGGKDTIIVITLGQHFRQFPLHLFIRRAINIRRAIKRLFLRSPDTKVIIKTENTRNFHTDVERIGDFNGYCQYHVLREVFQDINVGFVDAWDMTVSSATEDVHPPGITLENIMSMTFSFACS